MIVGAATIAVATTARVGTTAGAVARRAYCSKRRPLRGAEGLFDRRLEILFTAHAGVDDLAGLVDDDDVRRRGNVVRSRRVAAAIEHLRPRQFVLVDVQLGALGALIHRHRDADE